ncbi:hypothetical protein ACFWYW_55105 [Nonomuraea sp. NPDC059023]|uniref:hypothetical protein n=1 Tax=unclassified Nonomuraea TaxID=2593643 RepID=UPI0036CF84B2
MIVETRHRTLGHRMAGSNIVRRLMVSVLLGCTYGILVELPDHAVESLTGEGRQDDPVPAPERSSEALAQASPWKGCFGRQRYLTM